MTWGMVEGWRKYHSRNLSLSKRCRMIQNDLCSKACVKTCILSILVGKKNGCPGFWCVIIPNRLDSMIRYNHITINQQGFWTHPRKLTPACSKGLASSSVFILSISSINVHCQLEHKSWSMSDAYITISPLESIQAWLETWNLFLQAQQSILPLCCQTTANESVGTKKLWSETASVKAVQDASKSRRIDNFGALHGMFFFETCHHFPVRFRARNG